MALDLVLETFSLLASGGRKRGVSRVVRQVWLYAIVSIVAVAVMTVMLGSLTGHLEVPGDTKRIILWTVGLVSIATLTAGAIVLVIFLTQKLGSILGRVAGNTNVHPD